MATPALQSEKKTRRRITQASEYGVLAIVEAFPDALHPVRGKDDELRRLHGATIVRMGSTNDANIEGGGLLIDYRPKGKSRVHRVVFAFNDLGLWEVWAGPLPMTESASR